MRCHSPIQWRTTRALSWLRKYLQSLLRAINIFQNLQYKIFFLKNV